MFDHLTFFKDFLQSKKRVSGPFHLRFKSVSGPFPTAPPPTDTYSDAINIGLPPRGRD